MHLINSLRRDRSRWKTFTEFNIQDGSGRSFWHFSFFFSTLPVCVYQCPYNMKSNMFLVLSLKHPSACDWAEQCVEGGALKEMLQAGRGSRDLAASHHKGISSSATSCSGAVVLKLTAEPRPGASGCFYCCGVNVVVSLTLYSDQFYSSGLINVLPLQSFPLYRHTLNILSY